MWTVALVDRRRRVIATATLKNRRTATCFLALMALQIGNLIVLHALSPFLAALILNLDGAAMQFARLIRSAFR